MKPKHLVNIDRSFVIVIDKDLDGEGWSAHVVGHELDQFTCADTPANTAFIAAGIIKMLTGGCKFMDPTPHDWSIETTLDGPDDPPGTGAPAWQCSRCDEKCIKSEFEEG